MRENHDVIKHGVSKHGQVPVNGEFETAFFGVMYYLDIFCVHVSFFWFAAVLKGWILYIATWDNSRLIHNF
jgi:hypothetical protein